MTWSNPLAYIRLRFQLRGGCDRTGKSSLLLYPRVLQSVS